MPLCLFYRSWQSSMQRCYYYIACKKKNSFGVTFLRCKYFKNLKRVFISSKPQVKHKPNVWSHLPHCCLPLGTQHGRTQWKRGPQKAHTCLCNFDYQVINYHSILNITPFIFHYREISFSLVHSGPCFMLWKALSLSLSPPPQPSPAGLTVLGEFRSCSGMQHTFMSSEMPLYCKQLHLFHFQFLLCCK